MAFLIQPVWGQDAVPESKSEPVKLIPYLGESSFLVGSRFSRQATMAYTRLDVSLDTNEYANPRVFVDGLRARFSSLDFLKIPYDISEVWFGGGLKFNIVPGWLSLSAMVGTQWYVNQDEHLNPKLYPDADQNDHSQGVLLRSILTIQHPEKYFRFDFEANFNDEVNNDQHRQYYLGRLAVPVFKEGPLVLEAVLFSAYFDDRDLKYQTWEVLLMLGPRLLIGEQAVMGIDAGVGLADELNDLKNLSRHQRAVVGRVNVFVLSF